MKPGRYIAVAVWDSLEHTPGYAAASRLLERLFGATVAESLRSPYALGAVSRIRSLFDGTGLSDVSIETINGVARFDSIEDWMHTDVQGWTLAGALDDEQYALLLREAKKALQGFVLSDGRVEFKAPAHLVTAIKP